MHSLIVAKQFFFLDKKLLFVEKWQCRVKITSWQTKGKASTSSWKIKMRLCLWSVYFSSCPEWRAQISPYHSHPKSAQWSVNLAQHKTKIEATFHVREFNVEIWILIRLNPQPWAWVRYHYTIQWRVANHVTIQHFANSFIAQFTNNSLIARTGHTPVIWCNQLFERKREFKPINNGWLIIFTASTIDHISNAYFSFINRWNGAFIAITSEPWSGPLMHIPCIGLIYSLFGNCTLCLLLF